MLKGLDHLNFSVRSFEETAGWYGRLFGFRVVEDETDSDGVRWGVLRSGDAMLCIYEHPELEFVPADVARAQGRHAIAHFGLRITDRDAFLDAAHAESAEFHFGGSVRWPHSTSWYVTDPTGWMIEVALWDDDAIRFSDQE